MRPLLPFLLLLLPLCLSISSVTAAEPISESAAKNLITQASAALEESDTKPERIIDAALGFAAALPWYEAQGDTDTICDIQASLFWCRKRMDAETMKTYRAKLGNGDAETRATLAKVDAVAERAVDTSEAKTYLERADKFSKAHPSELRQITIRYFEVAERFQGTPASLTAQRLSLDTQQRWAKEIALGGKKADKKLPVASDSSTEPATSKVNPPDADTLKSLTSKIKDLYKSSYANSKERDKLIDTLSDQAEQDSADAASRFAFLTEAREIAVGIRDVYTVITVCDKIADNYNGPSESDQLREFLPRITGMPITVALLTLLDHENDAVACGVVGRWYAVDIQDWEHALPLLAKCNDPTLVKAANQELAPHTRSLEQLSIADQWYDLGKRSAPTKESFWRHALQWYEKGNSGLTGTIAATTLKHISEIEDFLPLGPNTDFSKLTSGQWEKLKGKTISVDGNRGPITTNIILSEGHPVRVVPHPSETWAITEGRASAFNTNWKGTSSRRNGSLGSLRCAVGNDKDQAPGIISGVGPLVLFAQHGQNSNRNNKGRIKDSLISINGTIRVKVIPVAE
jgi:hypothetical protein